MSIYIHYIIIYYYVFASYLSARVMALRSSPMPSITTQSPWSNGACVMADHRCARWCDSSCLRALGSRLYSSS